MEGMEVALLLASLLVTALVTSLSLHSSRTIFRILRRIGEVRMDSAHR